ncbi:splicing factor u2af large subunit [Dorcoceras hygrometricum]|uniref:Splicing factor u2af large subunit n=1 Tax=Dorcoceras hygrometricum TaxID=472368 RepID=A0A2Z7CG63_9LAMI|nr:splicing factor u2af large subunit [Dorcoceras hygrometricum]
MNNDESFTDLQNVNLQHHVHDYTEINIVTPIPFPIYSGEQHIAAEDDSSVSGEQNLGGQDDNANNVELALHVQMQVLSYRTAIQMLVLSRRSQIIGLSFSVVSYQILIFGIDSDVEVKHLDVRIYELTGQVFQLLQHSTVGIFQLLQHSAFDIFSCDSYSTMK